VDESRVPLKPRQTLTGTVSREHHILSQVDHFDDCVPVLRKVQAADDSFSRCLRSSVPIGVSDVNGYPQQVAG